MKINKYTNNRITNKKVTSALGAILFFTLYALPFTLPTVHAQQVRDITVIPPVVETTVNPGQKTEGILKLVNETSAPLSVNVDLRDYIVQDTVGTPSLLPPNTLSNKFSGSAWVGVVPNEFTIPPHQMQQLTYYLQVPKDAAPGGHYLAVTYSPLGDKIAGTGASINQVVGTIFKITVPGTINEYALVTNFNAPVFQENGPVKINAQIQNSGDLHIKPTGKVVITDTFGRDIQEIPLPGFSVFPTAARDYQLTAGSTWMIGRFQAKVIASYGVKNNLPLSAAVVFYVFPWKIAVIIILIIIAGILGILLRKKTPRVHTHEVKEEVAEPEAV